MIINMTGGGAGLNFKVVGGTTAPSNPKENTIWVKTSKEITGWVFSSTEPVEPEEGEVWFATGKSSNISINVLKKNCVMVYPLSAKQRVNGAWAAVDSEAYQGGLWHTFALFVYDTGNEIYPFTAVGKKEDASHGAARAPDITRNDDSITFNIPFDKYSRRCGIAYPNTKFDLTGHNKIKLDYNCEITDVDNIDQVYLCVYTDLGTYLVDNLVKKEVIKSGLGTLEVDVSDLTGEHYVCFWLYNYVGSGAEDAKITVNSMWLE